MSRTVRTVQARCCTYDELDDVSWHIDRALGNLLSAKQNEHTNDVTCKRHPLFKSADLYATEVVRIGRLHKTCPEASIVKVKEIDCKAILVSAIIARTITATR